MIKTLLTGEKIEIVKTKEFRGVKFYFTAGSTTGIPENKFKIKEPIKYAKPKKLPKSKPVNIKSDSDKDIQPSDAE